MSREIHQADGLAWCEQHQNVGAVVTSLPDPENIIFPEGSEYVGKPWHWFRAAIRASAQACHPEAPLVFRQTDRRDNGTHSKAHLLFDVLLADSSPYRLLWHKIVLHQDPETTDLHRPTFAHLLAFGQKGVKPGGGHTRFPDVLRPGDKLYQNGMGLATAERLVQFAARRDTTIVDPFCGRGTVPALADALGYHGVGVDLDPEQVAYAQDLRLSRPGQ